MTILQGDDLVVLAEVAASCSAETLAEVGDTDCISDLSLELSEINELFLDTKSATFGTPTNPVATYTPWADNEAVLLTWFAAKHNTTASKVRYYYGRGEKPEPTETTVTLRKNKTHSLGTRHTLVYTVDGDLLVNCPHPLKITCKASLLY